MDSSSARELSQSSATSRLLEVDIAKGIAIALVAWGHTVGRGLEPTGYTWWIMFKGWKDHLYDFHLSVFFFLAGVAFFCQRSEVRGTRYVQTAKKMLSVYMLFLLTVYFGALLASKFIHIGPRLGNPLQDIGFNLLYPTEGFVSYLWFIPCFVALQGIGVLVGPLSQRQRLGVLAVAFAIHLLSVNELITRQFELHQVSRYLLFFLLGEHYLRMRPRGLDHLRTYWPLWFVGFILSLVFLGQTGRQTVGALLSLPALMGLAMFFTRYAFVQELWTYLGKNTFTIYLLNTPSLGVLRSVALKLWSWDEWRFAIVGPLLFIAGMLVPIIVQRKLLSRWRWLDRLTR